MRAPFAEFRTYLSIAGRPRPDFVAVVWAGRCGWVSTGVGNTGRFGDGSNVGLEIEAGLQDETKAPDLGETNHLSTEKIINLNILMELLCEPLQLMKRGQRGGERGSGRKEGVASYEGKRIQAGVGGLFQWTGMKCRLI